MDIGVYSLELCVIFMYLSRLGEQVTKRSATRGDLGVLIGALCDLA